MPNIVPIPALKDNYIWLVIDPTSATCLIVDPGDAKPVINALQTQSLHPVGILLTHHHTDHTAGVSALIQNNTMSVFGPEQETIPFITHPLKGGEKIRIAHREFEIIAIPGHTHGHIAYYSEGSLFCGDTLFTGGCGRLFEGTKAQMYTSLQRLAALPDTTHIYCGHEYTAANLAFALVVEPDNQDLQQRIKDTHSLRERGLPTVPSTLRLEKATNPFLRCHIPQVKKAAEDHAGQPLNTAEDVFSALRGWKDIF